MKADDRRHRGDDGSGSVWVACLLGVLAVVAYALVAAGSVAALHARAVGAADLSALRGADVLQHLGTTAQACAAAATVATLNHASLVTCSAVGMEVQVTVAATAGPSAVQATARAGPARDVALTNNEGRPRPGAPP